MHTALLLLLGGVGVGVGKGLSVVARGGAWGVLAAGYIWASIKLDDLIRKSADNIYYITYWKVGPNGEIYVGRCSGIGKSAQEVLDRYDKTHRMNKENYGRARMDKAVSGTTLSKVWLPGSVKFQITTISGYAVYRGREQQLYDDFKLKGFTMGNTQNPVWPYNPFGTAYWAASTIVHGPLRPYGATC